MYEYALLLLQDQEFTPYWRTTQNTQEKDNHSISHLVAKKKKLLEIGISVIYWVLFKYRSYSSGDFSSDYSSNDSRQSPQALKAKSQARPVVWDHLFNMCIVGKAFSSA